MGASPSRRRDSLSQVLLVALVGATVSALAAGGLAWSLGATTAADAFWTAGIVVALVAAVWWLVIALRRGKFGVDVIAVLSLGGTLAVGEYLAGALIGVMLATGQALEHAAERRATKDLRALLERAPKEARRRNGDDVETVPLAEVAIDDVLVVGPGEMLPVDARVASEWAMLDESALTGESVHVDVPAGHEVRSGAINAGGVIEIRATATADDSTYAGIVRLAREAAATSAPVVRLADRLAQWFLPLTLVVAATAWWWSGSAARAVAVLVVATPCPLLLAAPVAIVSGLSRASRMGVIVRGGGALENLARATTLVLDKTGTVTSGRPRGTDIVVAQGWSPSSVLRLAASADQFSPHVLARAIVDEARERGLALSPPTDVTEEAGKGISAVVDGARVTVGNRELSDDPPPWVAAALSQASFDAAAIAWVTVDARLVGAILLMDPIRSDAPRTIRRLRTAGIDRVIMLTGDRAAPAEQIGAVLGFDEVRSGQTPAEKVARVGAERERAVTVMVGDGVNDAPALATATVGVAMGARGATASSEAADVVLTTDRLDRLADAMLIARRSRRIALQSAAIGMVLSIVAMGFAAVGLLPPALGALLQEVIDLSVILNALRALRAGAGERPALTAGTQGLIRRFSAEHDVMRADLSLLRDTAHELAVGDRAAALVALRRTDAFVQDTLLPHEHAEDRSLYPALTRPLGSPEATATMSRMHAEIDRLAYRLHAHLDQAEATGSVALAQTEDLLACLYGLHALLSLHFAAEEESYFTLLPDASPSTGRSST